jgi:hypothetical protein
MPGQFLGNETEIFSEKLKFFQCGKVKFSVFGLLLLRYRQAGNKDDVLFFHCLKCIQNIHCFFGIFFINKNMVVIKGGNHITTDAFFGKCA